MQTRWNAIVAGCGAVGSAALYQLARRGVRALGLDRFSPPHDRGSSHGDTRITRLAVGEGDQYVQFARRSHEIWRELEAATGRPLLQSVGGLIYGFASGRTRTHGAADFLETTTTVARRHHIKHEIFDAKELSRRFPQFHWRGDETGYFEYEAGFVYPESCIAAQLEMARRLGARIQRNEQVTDWKDSGGMIEVTTAAGRYECEHLILTAGAWLPKLVPELAKHARIFRQVLFWFEPDGPHELFAPENMPVYIRVPDDGSEMFYGFPAINGPGGGMKIAGEQFDRTASPDEMQTEVNETEMAAMHAVASPRLRISSKCVRAVACKYTVTPDFHFVIDRGPASERVWFASACSGHGFKHSAAVGEALAEMMTSGRTQFDLSAFRLSRFR